jgi:uncharacterized membrane protein YdbT with pleckstrin-like domain
MRDKFKTLVLRLLKVPAEPQAPAGSPGSVQVFRAAPNFYKLKLILWALRQFSGLISIVFFLIFWHNTVGRKAPSGVNLVVDISEWIGIGVFLVQIPFTFMLVRLDYEMRWYIVTDRSLRIRTGLWNVRESTLTFANIQQISVGQGPLQRLLDIYDLEVTTAGGGGSGGGHHGQLGAQGESMHRGFFHGIDNAPEVRELMMERLRRLRDTGLGDPDESHHEEAKAPQTSTALLDAARELLQETRSLRRAVG